MARGRLKSDLAISDDERAAGRDRGRACMFDVIVERDGKQLEFSYLPRGAEIPTTQWRKLGSATAECKV